MARYNLACAVFGGVVLERRSDNQQPEDEEMMRILVATSVFVYAYCSRLYSIPASYNERYSVDAPTNPDVSIDIAKLAWLSVHPIASLRSGSTSRVMMAVMQEKSSRWYDSDSDESYVAPHSARVDEDGDISMDEMMTIPLKTWIVSEHMPPSSLGSSVLDTSSSLEDMITPRLRTFLASFGEQHIWTPN
ncbi:hypothetical protein Hypma_005595 [Hypsizygus marmoreus]|uniref:Uncharacterized protein n=1 Tax=Hypsizygus marmoreus TaxID=39966 RepID=A0A369JW81_HYPMA|nr:hypothetical protein Hypma_005595 [Hypsizygus marmoreus]